MFRSTRHHILDANLSKISSYKAFIEEYSRVAKLVVDQVWAKLPEDLNVPRYLNYKDFSVETNLSARVLSSIATQVSGIIRAVVAKQRRRLWVQKNKNTKVTSVKFSKPVLDFIAPELSSKCCDIQKSEKGKFWGFLRLKSLGKDYGSINIPIIRIPRMGDVPKAGVKFFKHSLQLVWEIPNTPAAKGDKILGADTGLKTVLTLSDGQATPLTCPHGHTYESILATLSRKKKGSAAFKKEVHHRKNFVNWSINQLDFQGVKEVRLEKVTNIRYKRQSSRKLSHWSNPEIRDKIKRRCEELEVPIIEQSCAYRSQRCSQCGNVRKANRKGKLYVCNSCGFSADADFNAATNHSIDLPPLSKDFAGPKFNLGKGFFWKPNGIFTFDGAELRVPLGARISKSS